MGGLWQSWGHLPCAILIAVVSAASNSTSTNTTLVGDYIAQGLGAQTTTTSSSSLAGNSTAALGTAATTTYNGNASTSAGNLASAQSCNSEWISYSLVDNAYYQPAQYGYNSTSLSTNNLYTATTTFLCDNRTRVVGNITSAGITVSTEHYWINTAPVPTPTCTIDASNCAALSSSYSSDLVVWRTALLEDNVADFPNSGNPSAYTPHCNMSSTSTSTRSSSTSSSTITRSATFGNATESSTNSCRRCTINAGNVELYYFPVTTSYSRDMCAVSPSNGVTCPYGTYVSDLSSGIGGCSYPPHVNTTTKNSGPYTVMNGTTLYENRAYISYQAIDVYNECGTKIGKGQPGGMVELASTDVYSVWGNVGGANDLKGYPFNFADLIHPVPASAYLGQASCYHPVPPELWTGTLGAGDRINGERQQEALWFCGMIFDYAYAPWLAVPPQFRALDPAWEDCDLSLWGTWDPPVALTEVTSAAGVSTPIPQPSQYSTMVSATSTAGPGTTVPAVPDTYEPSSTAGSTQPTQAPEPVQYTDTPPADSPASSTNDGPQTSPASSAEASAEAPPIADSSAVSPDGPSAPLASSPPSTAPGPDDVASTTAASAEPQSSPQDPADPAGTNGGSSPTDPADPASPDADPSSGQAADPVDPVPQSSFTFEFAGSTHVVVASSGDVAVDGTTVAQAPLPTGGAPASVAFTASGQAITAVQDPSRPNVVNVDGVTVTRGGDPATVNGVPVSYASSGLVAGSSLVLPVSAEGAAATTFVAGSQTFEVSQDGSGGPTVLVAGGSTRTLIPGQATTIDGVTFSPQATGGIVIGDTSTVQPLVAQASTTDPAEAFITVGGKTVTATQGSSGSAGVVEVGGTTLSEGGSPITISGQVISVASNGIVVGSQTVVYSTEAQASPADPAEAVVTLGGQTLTAIQGSSGSTNVVEVAGTTLSVGGSAATISGQVISAASNGIVVGSQTVAYSTGMQPSAVFTASGSAFTAVEGSELGVVVVDGTTLSVGGPAQTVDGVVLSAATGGVVVGGSTTVIYSTGSQASQQSGGVSSTASGPSGSGGVASATSTPSAASAWSQPGMVVLGLMAMGIIFAQS
ncbi:hypothetical protein LTR10_002548 [Elasticomyces elasticus]|nr:hypothetical protein LTR10_002548 [Elasticomyces elasticus]KAK4973397.1 hypothetical protein LTR42_005382 [Elasticomyces elasticus]